ncbi:MAG: hypothetical protein A3C47_07060 [Omnitrophica bacterium RIFCSPHIGHO2_02_FULL_51_18]|nr:MAG: hypothetical protein A3C47_07060 [Omnitrophica bacterium RIFCSPHIGHO2_02_FULL_51_18]
MILKKWCLLPSLFLCTNLFADTVILKNGKEIKGLVVEEHSDRIIFSTERGEIPILRKGVSNIRYDDPAQNFMRVGKAYEEDGKLGEALAFYEKAAEVNPNFEEAQKAAVGVRNRFWASSMEGPRNEMEKQQVIYDSWGKGLPIEELIKKGEVEQQKILRTNLGVVLEKKGDWVHLEIVELRKEAALAGLKKNDRLISIDSQSLRYLGVEAVAKHLMLPRLSHYLLEFERNCFLHKEPAKADLKQLGVKLRLGHEGLVIDSVKQGSAAEKAGLKENDLLVRINEETTRYTPLQKVVQLIQGSTDDRIVFTVRRAALLARK